MGKLPEIESKPVVKAKLGDLRQMVLPGGGDVSTRVWASMRVKTESLRKWMHKGAYRTAAASDAIDKLEEFIGGEGQLFEHVWKDIEPKLALRIKVGIVFLIDAFEKKEIYNTSEITKLMEGMTDRAMNKGKAKAMEAYADQVAQSLKNGAGAAHKRTAIEHALPPLRLTFI